MSLQTATYDGLVVDSASQHSLLSGLPEEHVEPLLSAGHEVRYTPGDIIFREGDESDGLYLILAGTIQISATGPSGEGVLAVVKPTEVLGEMGVLDGAPRSGTATAKNICVLYFLPAERFLDLLERSTLVCMRLLVVLSSRLRLADTLIVGEVDPDAPAPL